MTRAVLRLPLLVRGMPVSGKLQSSMLSQGLTQATSIHTAGELRASCGQRPRVMTRAACGCHCSSLACRSRARHGAHKELTQFTSLDRPCRCAARLM